VSIFFAAILQNLIQWLPDDDAPGAQDLAEERVPFQDFGFEGLHIPHDELRNTPVFRRERSRGRIQGILGLFLALLVTNQEQEIDVAPGLLLSPGDTTEEDDTFGDDPR